MILMMILLSHRQNNGGVGKGDNGGTKIATGSSAPMSLYLFSCAVHVILSMPIGRRMSMVIEAQSPTILILWVPSGTHKEYANPRIYPLVMNGKGRSCTPNAGGTHRQCSIGSQKSRILTTPVLSPHLANK